MMMDVLKVGTIIHAFLDTHIGGYMLPISKNQRKNVPYMKE